MSSDLCTAVTAVLLVATAGVVVAQPAGEPQSTASTAAAGSATVSYRSAFDRYRPFSDQPLVPWRQANDHVGQIGGWKAYAREGQGGSAGGASARRLGTAAPGEARNGSGAPAAAVSAAVPATRRQTP